MKDIIKLSMELNAINDIDILLERILLEARLATKSDAGTIYTREGNELLFRHAQNDTLQKKLNKGDKLIYTTYTVPVNKSSVAGYVAKTAESLNIGDVYSIKDKDYSFDGKYDEKSGYRTKSMLTVPVKSDTGEVIGVIQIINRKNDAGDIIFFSGDDELFVKHFAQTAGSGLQKAKMTRTLIMRMIQMAEMRDPKETGAHVNRVGAYSVEIYERWAVDKGISRAEIDKNRDILRMTAMLHDVGKVGISDTILKKPARFTPEEFDVMKTHTTLGAELFSTLESEFDRVARDIALTHHENWDGTGYPDRPKGCDISIFGRVVAVADVFDALSCKRVYKDAWKEDDVLDEIKHLSGTKFDPEVVDAFFKCLPVIKSIAEKYPDKE
ncbi:MAG: HD domain-containing protein [Candidatus Delongbacteria bacterium]|nr:HD domain-containing protein [Candidatus Delongbacteria bacterium]MDY0016539.1 HD domain-containing protein [Candidatus Delongbacteria bacterium]